MKAAEDEDGGGEAEYQIPLHIEVRVPHRQGRGEAGAEVVCGEDADAAAVDGGGPDAEPPVSANVGDALGDEEERL